MFLLQSKVVWGLFSSAHRRKLHLHDVCPDFRLVRISGLVAHIEDYIFFSSEFEKKKEKEWIGNNIKNIELRHYQIFFKVNCIKTFSTLTSLNDPLIAVCW